MATENSQQFVQSKAQTSVTMFLELLILHTGKVFWLLEERQSLYKVTLQLLGLREQRIFLARSSQIFPTNPPFHYSNSKCLIFREACCNNEIKLDSFIQCPILNQSVVSFHFPMGLCHEHKKHHLNLHPACQSHYRTKRLNHQRMPALF